MRCVARPSPQPLLAPQSHPLLGPLLRPGPFTRSTTSRALAEADLGAISDERFADAPAQMTGAISRTANAPAGALDGQTVPLRLETTEPFSRPLEAMPQFALPNCPQVTARPKPLPGHPHCREQPNRSAQKALSPVILTDQIRLHRRFCLAPTLSKLSGAAPPPCEIR